MKQESVSKKDIEFIKEELALIKNILLSKNSKKQSLQEEINGWELLSDKTLEDFEESLNE